jgi:hypothetical protein
MVFFLFAESTYVMHYALVMKLFNHFFFNFVLQSSKLGDIPETEKKKKKMCSNNIV